MGRGARGALGSAASERTVHPHAEAGITSECSGSEHGSRCRSHRPGHGLPSLHVKLLRRTPWGWRPGTVTTVDADGWLTVEVRASGGPGTDAGAVRAWHHRDLRADVRPGDPVHVHERHSALAGRFGALSLLIASGVGPVPDPVPLEVWGAPAATVIDLRTKAPLPARPLDLAHHS